LDGSLEDNSISLSAVVDGSGSQNSWQKINRKRKRVAPPLSRKINLWNQEWVNYNVGISIEKNIAETSL